MNKLVKKYLMETSKGMRVLDPSTHADQGSVSLEYPPGRASGSTGDSAPPASLHGHENGACTDKPGSETQALKK